MKASAFSYARATSVVNALELLVAHGDKAKVLSGGQSLMPAMNLRLISPELIVDIGEIAELRGIAVRGDVLTIGALTRHVDLARSPEIAAHVPLLTEAIAHVAHPAIRNRGTLGGSLAHADPAADYPAAILALDAEIDLAGPRGKRTVKAGAFFVDLLQTAIAPDEILVEIRVPATAKTVAYVKTEQKASGFALAGAAVVIGADGLRVGITGVAAKAYRATAVEQALAGQRTPTAEAIALAAAHAADGVQPLGDIHASQEFRAHLAQVNTRRAIERALGRA